MMPKYYRRRRRPKNVILIILSKVSKSSEFKLYKKFNLRLVRFPSHFNCDSYGCLFNLSSLSLKLPRSLKRMTVWRIKGELRQIAVFPTSLRLRNRRKTRKATTLLTVNGSYETGEVNL